VEWYPPFTPSQDVIMQARPQKSAEQGYENVPILKRPLWRWEIAWYFFLEGISSGSYALCTMAELVDKERYRRTTSIGRWLSLATLLPCPPLLIADLGRPERFHHMLRIVKLKSPMNLGSWTLVGYGLFAAVQAALESSSRVLRKLPVLGGLQRLIPSRANAVMGMPFAWILLSYPGVLLSTTSIPVWGRTKTLGMLIASSSISSATAALSLIAAFRDDQATANALHKFELVATVTEAASLATYLAGAGKAAKPLVRGKRSKLFWIGAVASGLLLPTLLLTKRSKTSSVVRSVLTLSGALALKWAIVYSGRDSAMDRDLAVQNSETVPSHKTAQVSGATEQQPNIPDRRSIA
jgi:formate-dependent nitrite reductase membrane component NrfD